MGQVNMERLIVSQCFLNDNTPATIEEKLSEYVIGQQELVRAVADFVYYHVMRRMHPELPVRNLLVAGGSGTGKTEVFRWVSKLYGEVLCIKIVDGSRLSKDGWSGSYKIVDMLSEDLDILVIDEADKMCKPSYSSMGNNVSEELQSEMLKLLEGEYELVNRRYKTKHIIENLSVVLVGAFESIREEKREKSQSQSRPIGFGANVRWSVADAASLSQNPQTGDAWTISDEDLIHFGMMPEMVGRIAMKVSTRDLTVEDYLTILRSPHSRVATLLQVLDNYGVKTDDALSDDEIRKLIETSKSNHTGFRWVSAQVESRILEGIRTRGVKEEIRNCDFRVKTDGGQEVFEFF